MCVLAIFVLCLFVKSPDPMMRCPLSGLKQTTYIYVYVKGIERSSV